jgi:hypothetical protein
MKIFRRIKAFIRHRKNKAFLKSKRVFSWQEYKLRYDDDIIRHATLVSHFYHGYPYTCYFERVPDGELLMPWLKKMDEWCDKNCSGKIRHDIHRVIREKGLIHNEYDDTMLWSDIEDFSMNDIGGHDLLFYAFKDEKDYSWFKLRWQ